MNRFFLVLSQTFLCVASLITPFLLFASFQLLGEHTIFFFFIFFVFLSFLAYLCYLAISKLPLLQQSYIPHYFFIIIVLLNLQKTLNLKITLNPYQINFINSQSIIPGLVFVCLPLFSILAAELFQKNKKYFLILPVVVFLFYQLYATSKPQTPTSFPTFDTGIKIAAKSLEEKLFFGFGAGRFEDAYRLYKPNKINHTPYWDSNFTSSSNEYLEILTTFGLSGFLSYFFLILTLFINSLSAKRFVPALLILVVSIVNLFIPPVFSLRLFLFMLLGLSVAPKDNGTHNSTFLFFIPQNLTPLFGAFYFVLFLTTLLSVGATIYLISLYAFAEFNFQRSTKVKNPNNIYYFQDKAIQLLPQIGKYHLLFSQTSLAYANSIMVLESSPSSQTKKMAGNLLIQAINEAKKAVDLSPDSQKPLVNAAVLYRNLIGIVPDSRNFSLAFFQKAIQKDPLNPYLQIQVGNIFLVDNDYENAYKFFNNALVLRPGYGLALYGLAVMEKNQGQKKEAMKHLADALEDTPVDTKDYMQIKKELEMLDKETR
jgi:tetratricopeptide (TPR) repeat protein